MKMAGILEGIGSSAVNLIIILVAIVIGAVVLAGILLVARNSRKYKQYRVVIWQKDGFGQLTQRGDEGGIFVDGKTGNKRLFLRSSKVGLEPDNIPFLPTAKGNKVVYLLQTGLKNYRYIRPVVGDGLITFTVGEEDVNWALNSYEAQKKRFDTNWLTQYLPFIILAFCFMVMMVMFVYIFNKLPQIKEIALAMKEVTTQLLQIRTGNVVIS
jgi:hypothetical protein